MGLIWLKLGLTRALSMTDFGRSQGGSHRGSGGGVRGPRVGQMLRIRRQFITDGDNLIPSTNRVPRRCFPMDLEWAYIRTAQVMSSNRKSWGGSDRKRNPSRDKQSTLLGSNSSLQLFGCTPIPRPWESIDAAPLAPGRTVPSDGVIPFATMPSVRDPIMDPY